jgi:8-oxo-(d)GTP phosphatase
MSNDVRKRLEGSGCIPIRVLRDGSAEVLMIQRNTEEQFWEFPKGKNDEGETYTETAIRELFEETGVQGTLLPIEPLLLEYDGLVWGEEVHKIVRLFFCEVSAESKVCIEEKELIGYEWLSTSELEERTTFQELKVLARNAKDIIDKMYPSK